MATAIGIDIGGTRLRAARVANGMIEARAIAASSPEMWRDVCLLNGKNIVEMIEHYQFALNRIKKAIKLNDGGKLEALFRTASDVRRGMQ